jgi:hypothetical protein
MSIRIEAGSGVYLSVVRNLSLTILYITNVGTITRTYYADQRSFPGNPTIGNKPRWLWEAVALYEANFPWDPHMLSYLVNQKPPLIKELNEFSNPAIYEVGYFLAQFIVETYGAATLKTLIQNNGNLEDTLKLNDEEFTRQWFAFVKKKYGI